MLKKILLLLVVILTLVAIALGILIFFDQDNQGSDIGEPSEKEGGVFGFLGFGGGEQGDLEDSRPQEPRDTGTGSQFVQNGSPALIQVSTEPVAGATFVGTSTLRYVDRGTGHMYELDIPSRTISKISNTTIPKVYEAIWVDNGNAVLYRQLKDGTLTTSHIELLETGTTTEDLFTIDITPLERDIDHISVSPDTTRIASHKNNRITISNPDGTQATSFATPGNSWLSEWLTSTNLLVTTKSSVTSNGFSYESTLNGTLSRLLGDKRGLTTHSNNTYTLYSHIDEGTFVFTALNRDTGVETDLFPRTLPEKCVFVPNKDTQLVCGVPNNTSDFSSLPDTWYVGSTSPEDTIVLYDTTTGFSIPLVSPTIPVDVAYPQVTSDGGHMLFTNKKDLGLWLLDIIEAQNT